MIVVFAACAALSGCSREQRDWRSAEGADSLEAYDHFLERHPEGSLATQARARVAQLTEERDWQRASAADTADAYRRFLDQHSNSKWSQEARIRAENFSLEGQPAPSAVSNGSVNHSVAAEPAAASASAATTSMQGAGAQSINARADAAQTAAVPMNGMAQTAPVQTPITPKSDIAAQTAESEPASPPASQSTADAQQLSDSSFGIQLGAFSSEPNAHSEWQRLKDAFGTELGSLEPHVTPAATASGQVFRLQAYVESESKARAICAALVEATQPCVVVLPQH